MHTNRHRCGISTHPALSYSSDLLTYLLTSSRLVYLIRGHNRSRVSRSLAASGCVRSYQESYAHAGPPALSICMPNWPYKTCFPRQTLRQRDSLPSELIYAARWTSSISGDNVGWAYGHNRDLRPTAIWPVTLCVDCLLPIELLSLTVWACLGLFTPIDISPFGSFSFMSISAFDWRSASAALSLFAQNMVKSLPHGAHFILLMLRSFSIHNTLCVAHKRHVMTMQLQSIVLYTPTWHTALLSARAAYICCFIYS